MKTVKHLTPRVIDEDERNVTFTGNPLGIPNDEVPAFLEAAPQEGDPEREVPVVLRCRAEIVSAVDALRRQLGEIGADSLRTAEGL